MTFRFKAILIVSIAIVSSTLFPAVSYYLFRDFDERYSVSMARSINEFMALSEFNTALVRYDNAILRYLSGNDRSLEGIKLIRREVDTATKRLELNLNILNTIYRDNPEMLSTLKTLESMHAGYIDDVESVVKIPEAGKKNPRVKALSTTERAEKMRKLTANYNNLVGIYNQVRILVERRQNELQFNISILDKKLDLLRNWGLAFVVLFVPLLLTLIFIIFSALSEMNKIVQALKEVKADKPKTLTTMIDKLEPLIKDRNPKDEVSNLARTLRFLGLEVREKTKELSDLVITDEKTKLFNYRHFKDEFQVESMYARRFGDKMSLVMLDVDKFKHYNDTNGHLAGDDCLIRVANIIKNCVRETDLAARFGGEEFAILLPRTTKEQAFIQAERIRTAIESTYFPFQEKQPTGNLTASLGVATFPDDGEELKILTECADVALYVAKERGRNCVISFEKGMEAPKSH
ncbi:MAG: GGDEF domain-containing protein [Chloroherpetonaceae bacterium]|nr:GGDEF domain-containing protein [Chloroherpetonaceae bacterium]